MIKIENVEVIGWEHAIRGMRNPKNSWDKSDTVYGTMYKLYDGSEFLTNDGFTIGDNDLGLMKRLRNAGTDHRKYMRMIAVYLDITAPLYWVSELDTYKVGTVRNSCSFMHKGVSKPFDITDFSIHDERVYEVLSPLGKKNYDLIYPYETDEYKIYTCGNGRQYEVYRNGRIFSKGFGYTDSKGRERRFERRECKPSKTTNGYYELNIGGRDGERWLLHRLVATVWDPKSIYTTVNHKSGNKGDNSIENLEWCSLEENILKAYNEGLYNQNNSLHCKYLKWKNGHICVPPHTKMLIKTDHEKYGLTCKDIAEKYEITESQANNIISFKATEYEELFLLCYHWELLIDELNRLRAIYIDTKDDDIFQQIRCLLPCGYNIRFTYMLNYEVLANMYKSRKSHKLDEWRDFCKWVETLPYSELIIGE